MLPIEKARRRTALVGRGLRRVLRHAFLFGEVRGEFVAHGIAVALHAQGQAWLG